MKRGIVIISILLVINAAIAKQTKRRNKISQKLNDLESEIKLLNDFRNIDDKETNKLNLEPYGGIINSEDDIKTRQLEDVDPQDAEDSTDAEGSASSHRIPAETADSDMDNDPHFFLEKEASEKSEDYHHHHDSNIVTEMHGLGHPMMPYYGIHPMSSVYHTMPTTHLHHHHHHHKEVPPVNEE